MPHWEDSGWPGELNLEAVLLLSCISLSFTHTLLDCELSYNIMADYGFMPKTDCAKVSL